MMRAIPASSARAAPRVRPFGSVSIQGPPTTPLSSSFSHPTGFSATAAQPTGTPSAPTADFPLRIFRCGFSAADFPLRIFRCGFLARRWNRPSLLPTPPPTAKLNGGSFIAPPRPRSSVGQSRDLLSPRPQVRILPWALFDVAGASWMLLLVPEFPAYSRPCRLALAHCSCNLPHNPTRGVRRIGE